METYQPSLSMRLVKQLFLAIVTDVILIFFLNEVYRPTLKAQGKNIKSGDWGQSRKTC